MIVADASIAVNVVADDGPAGTVARDLFRVSGLVAVPYHVDSEVLSALRRLTLAGAIAPERALIAIHDFGRLRLARYPARPFLVRAYELRANISAYDALYVALAERLGCEFVTVDARLARAPGLRCAVRVL